MGRLRQSKLANLLFMYELQRKFAAADVAAIAVAAHPGYADTNLQSAHARATGSGLEAKIMGVTNRILGQPASMGRCPSSTPPWRPGEGRRLLRTRRLVRVPRTPQTRAAQRCGQGLRRRRAALDGVGSTDRGGLRHIGVMGLPSDHHDSIASVANWALHLLIDEFGAGVHVVNETQFELPAGSTKVTVEVAGVGEFAIVLVASPWPWTCRRRRNSSNMWPGRAIIRGWRRCWWFRVPAPTRCMCWSSTASTATAWIARSC